MTEKRLFGRVVADSALYGGSAAIAKALALVTVPYLTRALSPDGYGVADLATSTAALLTLVALFSGDIPAARAYGVAADETTRLRALSSYIRATAVVSIVVTLVLLPLAPFIAGGLWGESDLASLAFATLLLVPISGIQAGMAQTQRIRERPLTFAAISIVDLLAQLGLAVGFVAAGLGPAGVIIGFILGSIIGLVLAAIAAWKPLRAAPDWTLGWRIVASGSQFLPYTVMFVFADWALRSVVATAVGPAGVAELGVAIRIASVLSLLGAAFAMAWGPIGLARVRDVATAQLFGRVLLAYGAASVAAAFALAALGPELVRIAAGSGYEGGALILPGFALAYAIAGTEYVLVIAAGISDRGSRVALGATVGAIVQIAFALLLVPQVGIAALGPLVVLGRLVSFGLLLTSVRASVAVPLARLVGAAIVSAVAFGGLQLVIGQDAGWTLVRWALAVALIVAVGVLVLRLRRPPQTAAT